MVSVSPEVAGHIRKKDETLGVTSKGYFFQLGLVDYGVDKA